MSQHAPSPLPAPAARLFQSFWSAGFESAYQINSGGQRLDMLASTQHDVQVDHDYALLRDMGIRTARDGVRWHLIDKGNSYDFGSLTPMVQAAGRHNIQVIWTLCHYGWPDELDVFSAAFVDRFARYAQAVARYIADHLASVPFYTLINEISFAAWAMGHRGFMYPYAGGKAEELKRQFVRAAIAGAEAIWAVDPRARFVHGDPLIHIIAPRHRPDLAEHAAREREAQFHAFDMLVGRQFPQLGGHPRYLDIVALHYYHANQWELPEERLRWEDFPRDDRWLPLHQHLQEVYERYRRPLFLGETSHFGVGRAPWLREIIDEAIRAHALGVPLEGICLYPILDRHDWEDPNHWHHSGLWDLQRDHTGTLRRVLNEEYAAELRRGQQLLR